MADRYIDVFEVSEYGDFFLMAIKPLEGASRLVDVAALSDAVRAAKEKVETERAKAGLQRKGSAAEAVGTATEALRGHVSRFHSFLNSLDPEEVKVDVEKFFPGNVLAGVQQLKPADLKARAEKISEAFGLEAYQNLSVLVPWKKKLTEGQQALAAALSAHGSGRNEGITLTASLSGAREEFLEVYNGVAKNLIRGLLHSLSRGAEFKLFFKDLQVNEDARSKAPDISTPTTEPKPTEPKAS